jgi:hypothetical protein
MRQEGSRRSDTSDARLPETIGAATQKIGGAKRDATWTRHKITAVSQTQIFNGAIDPHVNHSFFAIAWSVTVTALIYKLALIRRKKIFSRLCVCGCGAPVKAGRTLAKPACRKRMQRRRDRAQKNSPTKPKPIPEPDLFTGKITIF